MQNAVKYRKGLFLKGWRWRDHYRDCHRSANQTDPTARAAGSERNKELDLFSVTLTFFLSRQNNTKIKTNRSDVTVSQKHKSFGRIRRILTLITACKYVLTYVFLGDEASVTNMDDLRIVVDDRHSNRILADLWGDILLYFEAELLQHHVAWKKNTKQNTYTSCKLLTNIKYTDYCKPSEYEEWDHQSICLSNSDQTSGEGPRFTSEEWW